MRKKIRIKIFADGADLASMIRNNKLKHIDGFTTNPSLMRKAGVTNYVKFAKKVFKKIKKKPISFEVFTDNINEMEKQGKEISSWGSNVYVKIPAINTKGKSTFKLIKKLTDNKIKCNITAVFTLKQVKQIIKSVNKKTKVIISIFAGRIADSGVDPNPIIKKAVRLSSKKNIEILWASTREVFNIIQAKNMKCQIITIPDNILGKYKNLGKSIKDLNIETVKTFYKDAKKSAYKI